MPGAGDLSLFVQRVAGSMRPPATCTPGTGVADVAAALGAGAAGAVIVLDADGGLAGIVTDRDLRTKVVAARRDVATTTAADIMSRPVVTVDPQVFAFDALLDMTRREIHHLAVTDGGRLVGVVASDDLVVVPTAHPVALVREIGRAPSYEALAALAARITRLVAGLVADGGRARDVGALVAELNDRLAIRVLGLAEEALAGRGHGRPPEPYCWLVFGSEGRREQTLRTDQDNGLVYADPPPTDAGETAAYFSHLAAETIAGLLAIGFPPCPGGAMASNARWCQPLATWRGYFEDWIDRPTPEHLLAAAMYFDLRPVHGALALGAALTELIGRLAPKAPVFLGALAREVAERSLPVTLFGGVAVERSGSHRGAVDLKGAGSLQLVGAGRLHALELGLAETNTVARFRAAGAAGLYSEAETIEIIDAYEHLVHLRLVHQLERLAAGEPSDNHVDPARLSRRDALLLRDAFKTIGRVQAGLRDRFGANVP